MTAHGFFIGHYRQGYARHKPIYVYSLRELAPVFSYDKLIAVFAVTGFRALAHLILKVFVDKVEHKACVLGVKLCSGAFDDLLTHSLLRDRIAVTSLRGHSVVGIRDCYHTRYFRYFLAFKSLGITVAVIAFVMIVRTHTEIREVGDAFEYLYAFCGMLLYNAVFFVGELSVLVDDASRNTDLSDIVQQRRVVNILAFLLALSAHLRKLFGIIRDSRRMTVSVLVLRIYRVYERCRSLIEQASLFFFSLTERYSFSDQDKPY